MFIGLQQVWFSAITFLGIQRMHLGEYWIVVTLANWCTRVECKYLLRLGFTLFYSQYSTINKCSLFLSLFLFFLLLAYSSINVFSMQHLGGKCALCPTLSFSIYVILFLLCDTTFIQFSQLLGFQIHLAIQILNYQSITINIILMKWMKSYFHVELLFFCLIKSQTDFFWPVSSFLQLNYLGSRKSARY